MCEKRLTATAIAVALSLGAVQARGVPITFEYSGQVTQLSDPDGVLDGSIAVGVTFTGSYTFESTMTDDFPEDPTYGRYTTPAPPSSIMTTTVGNHTFLGSSDKIVVQNEIKDFFSMGTYDHQSEGIQIMHMVVSMNDSDGSTFASDELPLTPPPLDNFVRPDFSLWGVTENQNSFTIGGNVTSLTPEPTSLCLLALGALALAARRRRH